MSDGAELYCICRSADVSRFMIGCERCNEWYHGDCIDVTAEEAQDIKHWYCHICQGKDPDLRIKYNKSKKHRSESRDTDRSHAKKKRDASLEADVPPSKKKRDAFEFDFLHSKKKHDAKEPDALQSKKKYEVDPDFVPVKKKQESQVPEKRKHDSTGGDSSQVRVTHDKHDKHKLHGKSDGHRKSNEEINQKQQNKSSEHRVKPNPELRTDKQDKHKSHDDSKHKLSSTDRLKSVDETKRKTSETDRHKLSDDIKRKSADVGKHDVRNKPEGKLNLSDFVKQKTFDDIKQKSSDDSKKKFSDDIKTKSFDDTKKRPIDDTKQKSSSDVRQKSSDDVKLRTTDDGKQKSIDGDRHKTSSSGDAVHIHKSSSDHKSHHHKSSGDGHRSHSKNSGEQQRSSHDKHTQRRREEEKQKSEALKCPGKVVIEKLKVETVSSAKSDTAIVEPTPVVESKHSIKKENDAECSLSVETGNVQKTDDRPLKQEDSKREILDNSSAPISKDLMEAVASAWESYQRFPITSQTTDESDGARDKPDDAAMLEEKETKNKKKSRMCGRCSACQRTQDCLKCDFCKDMKKYGGANRIRQKCRLRQCQNYGLNTTLAAEKRQQSLSVFESSSSFDDRPEPRGYSRERSRETTSQPLLQRNRSTTSMKSVSGDMSDMYGGGTRDRTRRSRKDTPPRQDSRGRYQREVRQTEGESYFGVTVGVNPYQCYGPGCVQPARTGSKYCSDDCGLALAAIRIYDVLPQRIQQWQSTPCVAELNNKQTLERIRHAQLQARHRLMSLDQRHRDMDAMIARAKKAKVQDCIESADTEDEAELNIFCVTCGMEIPQRGALRHLEKCFNKYEAQTSFGSIYKTRIEGDSMFCDFFNPQQKTYCKRLKVLCPEHCKEPKVSEHEVCGCPLVVNVFADSSEFCRVPKRKCNRHYCWEKLRRAEIDMERLRQWMLLDELFEQERHVRTAMSNRAGVLALMLHQTIDHDPMNPIKLPASKAVGT